MHVIQSKHMAQISETRSPQGIAAVVLPLLGQRHGRETRGVPSRDSGWGNFGTILRTLAWFGNFRCLCSADSVDLYNGKVVRASMGAIFHVPVEFDVPMDALRKRFPRVACLDLNGQPIASPAFREFDCYVFGNEARGLPHDQMATVGAKPFTIAGTGAIESLNVAATVNICLYELNRAS